MVYFRGLYLDDAKITASKPIKKAKIPKKAIIPLSQHFGKILEPLVKVGDHADIGQKIADSKELMSAPVHASVSGKIIDISEKPHQNIEKCLAITIESDGKEKEFKFRDIDEFSKEHLLNIIKEAGIVGLGGAMVPTHAKLNPQTKIDTVIINGAECEPFITSDHRLMLEYPEEIIKGIEIIIKILEAEKAIIGIENNKKDAIKVMASKTTKNIQIASLKTKYPQGAEKMLIYSLTKRKVPSGKLPHDINVVVQNVATCKAIYDAVYLGKPLIERVVTLTGAVKEPNNYLVRIGTSIKELIEKSGGLKGKQGKLIIGGPMMGIALENDSYPILKGTNSVLIIDFDNVEEYKEMDCIRCGKCIEVCPMELMPTTIVSYYKHDNIELANKYDAMDCIECGCCSYVCPSRIPLKDYIVKAKVKIIEENNQAPKKET